MGALAPYIKGLIQIIASWGGVELGTQLFGPGTKIYTAAEQQGLPKWLLPLAVVIAALLLLRYFFKSK